MVAVRRIDARLGGGVTGPRLVSRAAVAALLALLAAALVARPARANTPAPELGSPPGNTVAAPSPSGAPPTAGNAAAPSPAGTPAPLPTPVPLPAATLPTPVATPVAPVQPAAPAEPAPVAPAAPAEPAPAAPAEPPPAVIPWLSLPPRLPPTQIHAFVSQGYFRSTKNNYLVQESTRGSFEFTEVGINFTQLLTDDLRTGIQIFARQLGKDGDFRARMDWFYLDYHLADWLGIRAGRTKIPYGLYNEVNDIDSARIPILLPQAVYPIINRNVLLAQTGVELYGYRGLGAAGGLEYRFYGGTLFSDAPAIPPGAVLNRYDVPYLAGGRVLWETPFGLRLGGSALALRLNTNLTVPGAAGSPPMTAEEDVPFVLWLASAEYSVRDLLLAGEFGHWHADIDITGRPETSITNERFYAMATYRAAAWFWPGVYYSSLLSDIHKPLTRDNYQHDFAATLRIDLNPYWLVKLEGHYIDGTTDVPPALNGDTAPEMLARQWFLFLIKTTAYF